MEHEYGFQDAVGSESDSGSRSAAAVCRSATDTGARALAFGGGSDATGAARRRPGGRALAQGWPARHRGKYRCFATRALATRRPGTC